MITKETAKNLQPLGENCYSICMTSFRHVWKWTYCLDILCYICHFWFYALCHAKKKTTYLFSLVDIPKSIWLLLKNSIYLITSLGICCEFSIVSGFVTFLPKYFETQFGSSTSVANLFTGKWDLFFLNSWITTDW